MSIETEVIAQLPTTPGVYLMKNAAAEVIYVGKAANLRSRVRNYFGKSGDSRFSVQFLVKNVVTIDTIVTATEKDAFLLENTLIKQHRPRYNVQLRDDKTYISLRIRMDQDYPRLETVRVRRGSMPAGSSAVGSGKQLEVQGGGQEQPARKRQRRDPDLYFGPYISSSSVRETLRFLLKVFPMRTCRDSVFRNRTRPCILFDVGKCCGPCTEPVPKDEYRELVDKVASFLRGKGEEVRRTLQTRMFELSETMQFEKAAMVRDRLAAVDRTLERQQAATHERNERDVIAIASTQGRSMVVLQQFRGGTLVHSYDFYLKNYEQEDTEVLYSFISQHYDGLGDLIPEELLVSVEPNDCALLEEWLREQRGAGVSMHMPQRGKLAGLAHTATQNARMSLNRRLGGERTEEETLTELTKRLGLEDTPHVIECLDISNIMGVMAVGSIVRFEDAQPDKSGYRLFRIQTVEGSNDFAMIREVMLRRFRSGSTSARSFPDLFLVDGGKGQLSAAEEVFRELGIQDVQLAGIAKSRLKVREVPRRLKSTRKKPQQLIDRITETDAPPGKTLNTFFPDAPDYVQTGPEPGDLVMESPQPPDEVIRFRTEERVFLPGRKNPVTFAPNSPALHLIERIRDETHRTAITYHRKLRQKANRRSMLDEIPGIGPKRKKTLLQHFGSLSALKQATVDQIREVPGMGREASESVYQFLHAPPATETLRLIEIDEELLPEGTENALSEEEEALVRDKE
ncbi:MAG: excinuclease ABC subunit UvrC [Candidatus Sumerlaeaceae bacterium]